ncbi:hypothetical protein TcWFU_008525 [Taenia crassiceps]|uniref:Uncharacterized protein n=1 Tax=Taenia crassiceps TaxID=6207 RepID=A0ABR4QBS6_9CEST
MEAVKAACLPQTTSSLCGGTQAYVSCGAVFRSANSVHASNATTAAWWSSSSEPVFLKITHICAKCWMHWRKYGELPNSPLDEKKMPCAKEKEDEEKEKEVKKRPTVDKASGEHAMRIEAAPSTTQQLQDGVSSIENQREKSVVATAAKVTKISGTETTTTEVSPGSVSSVCNVYSSTYASCQPSPLLKLEGGSSDNELYITAAPPTTTDSITATSVSPALPPADRCPIGETSESVFVEDAAVSVLAKALSKIASTYRSTVLNDPKYLLLRNVLFPPINTPPSLSSVPSTSSTSSKVHNFGNCALPDAEFTATVTASKMQPSSLSTFQSPQPNVNASLPPRKRFTAYMASAAAAAVDFDASSFKSTFEREQIQFLMQKYFLKTSHASQQSQQQQQLMEIAAKARVPAPPPVSAHLPMKEPNLLVSTECFVPLADKPLSLNGTIGAVTHVRNTFCLPTGVPSSGSTASMLRQQQQQQVTPLQSIHDGVNGEARRYPSTSSADLRPPQPQLPSGSGLSGPPPPATTSARFQCAHSASPTVVHSTKTIPNKPTYTNTFVKYRLIAPSTARPANLQPLRRHQQSQQRRSSIATTGTTGTPAERVQKMNQVFVIFTANGTQKSSASPSLQRQQQNYLTDPTMDATTSSATFRPQTAIGEAKTSDVMHLYQLAHQQQEQQQQQWQQHMQHFQRLLQAATPRQRGRVMEMFFSYIQQQQQQYLSTSAANRLTQPPPAAFYPHQHQSSMLSSFTPLLPPPTLLSQYRSQKSETYSQQSQPKVSIPPSPSLMLSSAASSLASGGTASTSTSSTALPNSTSESNRNASAFQSQQQQGFQMLQQIQPQPTENYANGMNFSISKLTQMTQLTMIFKLYGAPNPALVATGLAVAANAVDSAFLRDQQHQHPQQQQQQQHQQYQRQHIRPDGGNVSSTQPSLPSPQPLQASVSASVPSRGAISSRETEANTELPRLIAQHHSPQSTYDHQRHPQQQE